MEKETQRLLSLALYYVEASLKDMQYQASMQDVESFNMDTDGTPCFDSDEELSRYLDTMQDYVNELKGVVK
jgi:hypothetical protein